MRRVFHFVTKDSVLPILALASSRCLMGIFLGCGFGTESNDTRAGEIPAVHALVFVSVLLRAQSGFIRRVMSHKQKAIDIDDLWVILFKCRIYLLLISRNSLPQKIYLSSVIPTLTYHINLQKTYHMMRVFRLLSLTIPFSDLKTEAALGLE